MPKIIVDIEFNPLTKKAEYPLVIGILSGTELSWRLRRSQSLEKYYGSRVRLSIYFEEKSPFRWNNLSSEQFYKPNRFRPFYFVEDIVELPGEYKYGIKTETTFGDVLFDEDPILIVYPKNT